MPRESLPAEANSSKDAFSLLRCYAAHLHELADAIDAFTRAPLDDVAEVRKAAGLLRPAIDHANAAYVQLASRRIALMSAIMLQPNREPDIDTLICRLSETETYQWNEVRPRLNALLLDIIATWRDEVVGKERIAAIHEEVGSGWPELRGVLTTGAERFALGGAASCSAGSH
jgi:hypothetical protein